VIYLHVFLQLHIYILTVNFVFSYLLLDVVLFVFALLLIHFLFLLSLTYSLLPLSLPLYLGRTSFLAFKEYALVLFDFTSSLAMIYEDPTPH
jgi:hypothetical protein